MPVMTYRGKTTANKVHATSSNTNPVSHFFRRDVSQSDLGGMLPRIEPDDATIGAT